MRGEGSKERNPPGAWTTEIRRRECEDFAPRNEDTRVRGERGAKRGGRRSRGMAKSGGENVKILLPGTEVQGLAGSGERGAKRGGRRECGGAKSGGENVKILLPGTEVQGLAGSGEQREEAAGRAEKSGAQLEG